MTTAWHSRNRDYIRTQNWQRRQRLEKLVSDPRRGPWTAAEDSIVLRDDISMVEKMVMLQRSESGVDNRLHVLRSGLTRTCLNCNAEFLSEPRQTRGMYCSRQCHYSHKRSVTNQRMTRQCVVCGKDYRARNASSKFCSLTCFGEDKRSHKPAACICGATIQPKVRSGGKPQKYCSTKCYGAAKTVAAAARNTRECSYCGKEFVSVSAASGRTRFCSRECGYLGRPDARPLVACESCGREMKKLRDNQRFCSMACRRATRLKQCETCGTTYWRHNPNQRFCSQVCVPHRQRDSTTGQWAKSSDVS